LRMRIAKWRANCMTALPPPQALKPFYRRGAEIGEIITRITVRLAIDRQP